jgi:DNA repair exonuclease SbcCD ATPase subunit
MSKNCISCGNVLNDQQRFCTKCGTEQIVPEPVQQVPEPDQQVAEPAKVIPEPIKASPNLEMDAITRKLNEALKELETVKAEKERQTSSLQEANEKLQTVLRESKGLKEQLDKANSELQNKESEPTEVAAKTQPPFPDSLIATIREFIQDGTEMDQKAIDMIYIEARAAGISDERTKSRLVVESERFKRNGTTKQTKAPKPKKKWWVTLLIVVIIIAIVVALLILAFIFQNEVLNTLDSWGLQTSALRNLMRSLN